MADDPRSDPSPADTGRSSAAAGRARSAPALPALNGLAAAAIIIAGLYFGRVVLIPFALALLLTFLLAPLVLRLRHWGLARVPAVLVVATAGFAVLGAATYTLSSQLLDLANQLPGYQENMRGKLRDFSGPGSGVLSRASQVFEELRSELSPAEATGAAAVERPIPVEIREPDPTSLELLRDVAGSLLGPLTTGGVVIVLVIFMLIQREDLRDRLIGLVGTGRVHVTTEALDDAAKRISRYLLMQLLVNLSYGIPVGVGLYFIGVPNPVLWGLLSTLLRFVPYLGPLLAMAMPLSLAFAVDPGWTSLLLTLGLFGALELFSNNIMEPWLYGTSTGISPVAIMMAAIFWTWIWGPIGLLMSTPMTVCLVVLGRHFPQLHFLSTVLGTADALPPEVRFYQRLLAADLEEATEVAEEFHEEGQLVRTFDQLLIPALTLAEVDRHRGVLDEERKQFVLEHARELAQQLAEQEADRQENAPAAHAPGLVVVPARDETDEIAALMLTRLLAQRGVAATLVPSGKNLGERLDQIGRLGAATVCVCAVPPSAVTHAAYTCKRLRRALPGVRIVVGLYSVRADAQRLRSHLPPDVADEIVTSLGDAVDRLLEAEVHAARREDWAPAPVPANEQKRLAELISLELLDTPPEEALDRVTRELAHIFGAPISLMSLIDGERQFWKSQYGLPPELALARASDRDTSMCGHVVAQNEVLVIDDVQRDPRFAANPFLQSCGVRFYAGAPLRTRQGAAVGSLCVIDTKPRQITGRERELLRMVADAAMTEMELRQASRELNRTSQQLVEENEALQGRLREAHSEG